MQGYALKAELNRRPNDQQTDKDILKLGFTSRATSTLLLESQMNAMQSPLSSEWDEEFFDSSKPLEGVVVCCTSIPANERVSVVLPLTLLGHTPDDYG